VAYHKPTLVETYAELYLAPGTLSQSTMFDVVPELKKLGFTDVELNTVGFSVEFKQGNPSRRETQRVRCWKPGRTQLVQVGEDLLVVNLTGQYPGWTAFTTLFSQALTGLHAGVGEPRYVSMALGAIDQFSVMPDAGYHVSDFLAVGGAVVPSWYSGCRESLDMDLGHGILASDGHNRQIHINVRVEPEAVNFMLRTEFRERIETTNELTQMLGKLHDESNVVFEQIITDRLRKQVMGGKK